MNHFHNLVIMLPPDLYSLKFICGWISFIIGISFIYKQHTWSSENITINAFPDGESLYQHLEEGYVRLFISAKGGIAAPLYESCYEFQGAPLMGRAAAEMKKRFEAKGLSVSESIQEPPDHLSIELEYLYFLLNKGWREEDEDLAVEGSKFAAHTMLLWVSELSQKLANEEECRFYPLIATILLEILYFIGSKSETSN